MPRVKKLDLGMTALDELFMNDKERAENKLPKIFDIPLSLQRVHYIDTNIYTNNFVEYRTQLLFDELIFFYQTEATIYFDKSVFNISHGDILFLPAATLLYFASGSLSESVPVMVCCFSALENGSVKSTPLK